MNDSGKTTNEVRIAADDLHWFEPVFQAWSCDDFQGVLEGLESAVNHFMPPQDAHLAPREVSDEDLDRAQDAWEIAAPGNKMLSALQSFAASLPVAKVADEDYKRMFISACESLAIINEYLGLDPNDGGSGPIIEAIAELKASSKIASNIPPSVNVTNFASPNQEAYFDGWNAYRDAMLAQGHVEVREPSKEAMDALANYRQIDDDGVMVSVSRQALEYILEFHRATAYDDGGNGNG